MKNNNLSSPSRQRTSVAIQGIDTSTPDDLVADGKCSDIHNLRWKDNAWRPVYHFMPKIKTPLLAVSESVVYHHPATGDNIYILEKRLTHNQYIYSSFDITSPSVDGYATTIASFTSKQRIQHFGNILIFMGEETKSFLWQDNAYVAFNIPPYVRSEITQTIYSASAPELVRTNALTNSNGTWKNGDELGYVNGVISGGKYYASWFPLFNYTKGYSCIKQSETSWVGEMLVFTTYRMEDGTPLSPSPLQLIKSNGAYTPPADGSYARRIGRGVNPKEFEERVTKGESTDDLDQYLYIQYTMSKDVTTPNIPLGDPSLRAHTPTLRLRVPSSADTNSVKSIAIWGTRINPIYTEESRYITERDALADIVKSSNSFVDYYANNDLANQPFYLIDEVDIADLKEEISLTDNKPTGYLYKDITLTYSLLENVVHNMRYTPSNNVHGIRWGTALDYNNSLHVADATTILTESYHISDSDIPSTTTPLVFNELVEVDINNSIHRVVSTSLKHGLSVKAGTPFEHVVSYPDFRATKCVIDEHFNVLLREAKGNNFAWYTAPHTEAEKFPAIPLDSRIEIQDLSDTRIVAQNNCIRVSSPNNPFSFPFENSYSFGSQSNRVIAMQSAAIEMHEMKIGEMPLYVFTEEGVYALIAGGETLYASVAAINYDKIINPNTLAVNGAIVYITEKGVHLLTSAGTQVISSPIHNEIGMPPLDFLRDCKIIWPKQYNEIVLLAGNGNPSAYVYNLDSNYWSTRFLVGTKLNTDELYVENIIYDLNNEDESNPYGGSFSTRPIKLGNVEFKRLETIIPRMNMGSCPAEVTLNVSGSVNGIDYTPLRNLTLEIEASKNNPIVIRRTPFSAKYFKVDMGFAPEAGENLTSSFTHIDFEWFVRFLHRMR